MSRISQSTIILVWLIFATLPLEAKIFTFNELNCRCEVPDTWVFLDSSGELVHVVDIPRTKSFDLRVLPVNRTISLDNHEFLSGFDHASLSQGFTIKDRHEVLLSGVEFHEVVMTKDLGNKTLNVCNYVTLADGYGYNLRFEAYTIDPDQDDEIKGIIHSFAFLKPPQINRASTLGNLFTPPDTAPHSAAYLMGYWFGILIVLAGFLSVILIPVAVTWYLLTRSKKRQEDSRSDSRTPAREVVTQTSPPPPPPQEVKTLHILLSDGQQAVYDENQVREMLHQGTLTQDTYFWMEGMAEWRPLQELPPPRVASVAPPRRG